MKNILVGICLVLFMAISEVSASEILVTIPKTLDEDYICSEDLIQDSSVNWGNVGEGRVDYFNKSDMSFLSKDVIISDINRLEEGINIPDISTFNINESITINKIVNVEEGKFFILGKIDNKNYPYVSEIDNKFAYIAYYENNTYQWEMVLKETRYGELVDGVITEAGIAVIGQFESINHMANVFISILSFNKKVIFDQELDGSLNDYARDLYNNNGTLIFTGVSESKDGDYPEFTATGYDIFIGNIDLATFSLNINMTGNDGNDDLISSAFNNGFIYLYVYLRGGGNFYNNNGMLSDFKCILEVNDRYDITIWKSIEELNDLLTEDIFIYNESIVVSYFEYGSSILHFNIYDMKLNFLNHKTFEVPNVSILKEYKIKPYMDNLYLTTLSKSKDDKEINTIHNLDYNFNEKSNYFLNTSLLNNKIIEFDFIDSKLRLNVMDRSSSTLNSLNYSHIKLVRTKKEFPNYYLDDYDIYINSNLMDKELVNSNVPKNAFGVFEDLYSVKLEGLEIVLPIEKYYYPNINLKNKETYDLGVTLKFNGVGYLNDEAISSNYKVEEVGKYVLEIIGSNEERKVINFNILPLSLSPTELEDQEAYLIQTLQSNEIKANITKIEINNEIVDTVDNIAIVIIFSLVCAGIVLGLVLPINFWRKKDA